MILKNIQKIKERILVACQQNNRNPNEVKLLLATKTIPAEVIQVALSSGETLIAENKIQEVVQKYDFLKNIPHTAHFIGHLQTNKVKYALKCGISCVHSVDRIALVEELDKRLKVENKTMDILIQVNTSEEERKFGIKPENILLFVEKVSKYSTIRVKGLMTIGLFSSDEEKVRACFRKLKELSILVANQKFKNVEMKELSMGMSNDLEIAIAEGATIIRVGTAIFGERNYNL